MIRILKVNSHRPQKHPVREATRALRNDELVIFPTETLYGLGARGSSRRAVMRLIAAKERPEGKGFILLISSARQASKYAAYISPEARRLMRMFWPGPLTLIFKKKRSFFVHTTGPRSTIALRTTSHPLPRAIIRALGEPITAPSANISGHRAPRTARQAVRGLSRASHITLALDAGISPQSKPSTVVDVSTARPRILREGAISKERILRALRNT